MQNIKVLYSFEVTEITSIIDFVKVEISIIVFKGFKLINKQS